MATLEELEKRIQKLDDVKQIERLQRIYGYYRDYGEWEKCVDLFSDNAVSIEVADHGVYKGKEGIRRYYLDLIRGGPDAQPRPGAFSVALQMQGVVTVNDDGRTASGRWYGFLMEARPTLGLHFGDLRQTWGHGVYENEYVRENGRWLINKLHFFLNFRTPFEDGWLKTPVIGQTGPSPDVPPDEPSTTWHPYPSGVKLPVHFKHPITGE
ncbi:MAG: nuclear transport factor 2 family protein [Dehalococcoidales bacterium]|nr:nuclear transport factor 2 family protein [Dehalococcoidales bacterium]